MRSIRYVVASFALVALAAAGRAADRNSAATAAQERQRKLIAVLQSDAPAHEKAIACKQLAIYGNKDAVPALAALLPDEELVVLGADRLGGDPRPGRRRGPARGHGQSARAGCWSA